MHTVTSKDGTKIGYTRTGEPGAGRPGIVLVHGMATSVERWEPVLPRLAETFTVYAMDRRGRGLSGDNAAYSLDREFEDVASLVDRASDEAGGTGAYLFGHSYGGLCALHGALLTPNVKRLAVYEPYVAETPATETSAATLRYVAMAEAGERAAIVETFMREIIQLNDAEIAATRAHKSWEGRVAAAHTIPRELAAAEKFRFEPARFAKVPFVGMLVGGASPAFLKDATNRIATALPRAEVVTLAGQKHAGMQTSPALFVTSLRDLLLKPLA